MRGGGPGVAVVGGAVGSGAGTGAGVLPGLGAGADVVAAGAESVGGTGAGAGGASDALGRVLSLADALVVELGRLSLEDVGRGVLAALVAALGRVRAGADAAEARAVTALDGLGDGGVDAVEVLRRNAGSSQREARRRRRRAGTLAGMPNVAGALAKGAISPEHADGLVRAAAATSAEAVDGDAGLLAQVAEVPADRAGRRIQDWTQRHQDPADLHELHLRQRRRRRLHFGDGDDGMLMAHAAFDRVLGAQFRSLINGIADRIWRAEGGRDNPESRTVEQRRLDALAIAVGLHPGPPTAAPADNTAAGGGAADDTAAPADNTAAGAAAADDSAARGAAASGVGAGSGDAGGPGGGAAASGVGTTRSRPPCGGSEGHTGGERERERCVGAARPAAGDEPSRVRGDGSSGEWGDDGSVAPGSGDGGETVGGEGRGVGVARPLPSRHQVVVVASTDVVSGKDPQGRCEIPGLGPIPVTELERLACDAELFGLLFSGDGEPLWHGRGERSATDAQRRALVARDGGCVLCAAEPAWCEAHHIVPWAPPGEGPTDIDNLALLCNACHHRLHDNKRILTRDAAGSWGTAPDPRHAGRRTTRHRRPAAGRASSRTRRQACREGTYQVTTRATAGLARIGGTDRRSYQVTTRATAGLAGIDGTDRRSYQVTTRATRATGASTRSRRAGPPAGPLSAHSLSAHSLSAHSLSAHAPPAVRSLPAVRSRPPARSRPVGRSPPGEPGRWWAAVALGVVVRAYGDGGGGGGFSDSSMMNVTHSFPGMRVAPTGFLMQSL